MSAWFVLTSFFEHDSKRYLLFSTLRTCAPRLLSFMAGVMPLFLAYALFGVLLFGRLEDKFGSISAACTTLFAVVSGDSVDIIFNAVSYAPPTPPPAHATCPPPPQSGPVPLTRDGPHRPLPPRRHTPSLPYPSLPQRRHRRLLHRCALACPAQGLFCVTGGGREEGSLPLLGLPHLHRHRGGGGGQGSSRMAVHRRRRGSPPSPPDQSDHRGKKGNCLEERALDQAQPGGATPPHLGGHSRSVPQCRDIECPTPCKILIFGDKTMPHRIFRF